MSTHVTSIQLLEARCLLSSVLQPGIPLPDLGGSVQYAAPGDFNGDGVTDLALAGGRFQTVQRGGRLVNAFQGSMEVAINDGTGHFRLQGTTIAVSVDPRSMISADIDGDGRADVVMADGTQAAVYLGAGDGTFLAPVSYAANEVGGGANQSLVGGDFNGDGSVDLAVAGFAVIGRDANNNDITQAQIAVLLNNGDGTFAAPVMTHNAGKANLRLAIGNFNGDARTDLAVGAGSQLKILTSKGDGTFNFPALIDSTLATEVAVADFNNDGRQDVAWLDFETAKVALGNGTGAMGAPRTLGTMFGGAGGIVAGDFNGDGRADVIASPTASGAGYFLGSGNGKFAAVSDLPADMPVAVADFNFDGRPDVLPFDARQIFLAYPPPAYTTFGRTLVISGTRRSDTVTVGIASSRVAVTLNGQNYSFRPSRVRRINIVAGWGNDRITIDGAILAPALVSGGNDSDTITGGSGNDTLQGDNGNDVLVGGAGLDLLQGGKNDDDLTGGAGNDEIFGNRGLDTFHSSDAVFEWEDKTADEPVV